MVSSPDRSISGTQSGDNVMKTPSSGNLEPGVKKISTAVEIPTRTSSKGFIKNCLKRQTTEELKAQRSDISLRISDSKKKLKAQPSFDSDYWVRRTNIAEKELEHARLQKRISVRDFMKIGGGREQEWVKTAEARKLFEQEKLYLSEQKIYSRQAQELKILPGQKQKNMRRAFMQLFTTSSSGLGVSTGMGRRDTSVQSNFRKALIEASNAAHPTDDAVWCPVLSKWVAEDFSTAAHLFSYKHGQAMMDAIFGTEKGADPELFSPRNGIIMDARAEKKFDKGLFTIVPLVSDELSEAETAAWHASEPKGYKIRITNPKAAGMSAKIDVGDPRTWNDLDEKELSFRNSFRPRARYLYFVYCCTMLRCSWQNQKEALNGQLGKKYWGTGGRFMCKSMLLAFVEEMGHKYENLLEGAKDHGGNEDDEPIETALLAATAKIRDSWKTEEEGSDSESESDGIE